MSEIKKRSDSQWKRTAYSLFTQFKKRSSSPEVNEAWRRLIADYERPILTALRRRLGPRRVDKAAVDGFFTYLYEQDVLPKYDREQGLFRTYIQGVVRRYALSLGRKLPRGEAEDTPDVAAPVGDDSLESDARAWSSEILRNSLRHLSVRDQELLTRCYGLDDTEPPARAELAAVLGTNPNALNVAVHKARARLEEHLLEELRQLASSQRAYEKEKVLVLRELFGLHGALAPEAVGGGMKPVPARPPRTPRESEKQKET